MIQSIFPSGFSLQTAANRIGGDGFSVVKSALRADGARDGGHDVPAALAAPADRVELQSLTAAAVAAHIHPPPPLYGWGGSAKIQSDAEPADADAEAGDDRGVAGSPEKDGENAGGGEAKSDVAANAGGRELDAQEQKQVNELEARDREVRAHEQAHKAAGGQYAGSVSYTYQRGPDGHRYAIGGEVSIDISPERDPAATAAKMRQVRAAAMAPADPSPQDRAVAAKAAQLENEAKQEANRERAEQSGVSQPLFGGSPENAGVSGRAAGNSVSPTATLETAYARHRAGAEAPETVAAVASGSRLVDVTA